jgi:hypothetical protein
VILFSCVEFCIVIQLEWMLVATRPATFLSLNNAYKNNINSNLSLINCNGSFHPMASFIMNLSPDKGTDGRVRRE